MIAKARPPVEQELILEEKPAQRWSIQLTFPQLVVGWCGVALLMVLTFLSGLYAGRHQGVELALEEQSTPRLRLPVTDNRKSAPKEEVPVQPVQEDRFDFSVAAPAVPPAQEPPTSFAAKPANLDAKVVEKPVVETPKSESLSERVAAAVEISPALQQLAEKPALTKVEKLEAKAALRTELPDEPRAIAKPEGKVEKKPAPSVNTTKGGFYVQVSAPDSMSQAQSIVGKLRSKGVTAAIRDVEVGGKLRYRVLVGPFASNEQAQSAKQQVQRSGVVAGQPFVKKY